MCEIMDEEKKSELDRITIKGDVLRKYFPRSYTPLQMQQTIIKLLEAFRMGCRGISELYLEFRAKNFS